MLTVNNIREFLAECKTKIDGINFVEVVADDSELTKFLEKRTVKDNSYLIAVIPEYKPEGTEDSLKWNNSLQFFILDKSADSNFTNHDKYIDMFSSTQAVAREFVDLLLLHKTGDGNDFCGIMNNVKENSFFMYHVWRKAQCNGWKIDLDLLTDI